MCGTDTFKENDLKIVCGKEYRIIRLLGHGKGGYSYLAEIGGTKVVLKQIHHEPCDYYSFGNKIEAERSDYERLRNAGIRMPQLLDIDMKNERIVKTYIEGPTVFDCVRDSIPTEPYLDQVREMALQAKNAGLNIDYFPTNFVIQDGLLWYVDYECNEYMDEWNFENWGIKYWSRTPAFENYILKQKEESMMIRQMLITDYEKVYSLWLSCKGVGLNNVDDSKEGIKKFLAANPTTCFVAAEGEDILGCILIGTDGRRGYIYHLAVSPARRKEGIGRALVEKGLDACRMLGITKTALMAFKRNEEGIRFWNALGFKTREDLTYQDYTLTEITYLNPRGVISPVSKN